MKINRLQEILANGYSPMKPRLAYVLVLLLVAGVANLALSTVQAHLRANPTLQSLLDHIPLDVGPWTGEPTEVDAALVKPSEEVYSRSFVYRHEATGSLVWMAVSIGPPGLVTEELPEKTYRFIGYAFDSDSKRYEQLNAGLGLPVEGSLARMNFWSKDSPIPMSVWHGWFDGAGWSRPDLGRFKFLGHWGIARVQVWCMKERQPQEDGPRQWKDPSEDFVKEILPRLTEQLAPLHRSWSSVLAEQWRQN